MSPDDDTGVHASSLVLAVPAVPVVADGVALESVDEEEDKTVDADEADCAPQNTPNLGCREDAEVEKQEGKLADGNVDDVDGGVDVEIVGEVCDLLGGESPNVPAETVLGTSDAHNSSTGRLDQGGDQNHPVVETEKQVGREDLDTESLDDEETGQSREDRGRDQHLVGSITLRYST